MQSTRPAFQAKLRQMTLPLAPLVRLNTGDIHRDFPSTLLSYWLLTSSQCDELAHFYHQRSPSPWSRHYPCPIQWKMDATLEEKRRRIGRFIGLRGCESPVRVKTEEEIMSEVRDARVYEDDEMMRKRRWY